jgi:hypothetical protein
MNQLEKVFYKTSNMLNNCNNHSLIRRRRCMLLSLLRP